MAHRVPVPAAFLSVICLTACGAAHSRATPPTAKASSTTGAATTTGTVPTTGGTQSNAGTATTASPTDPGAADTNRGPMLLLGDASNGRTVTVRRGRRIEIQLHRTYWRFSPPTGVALTVVSGPSYAPVFGRGCVPGAGCGTVTLVLRAVHAGTARVQATRRSCGEALVCPPAQRHYTVTIKVAR